MPEPNVNTSMYASWYRQTYPDKVLAISQTSNEGLVSVDNSGTVRLWETGVANLAQSMTEWKVGSDDWYFVTKIVLTYCEKNLRSLEQFIQTVKGKNHFWYRMLF